VWGSSGSTTSTGSVSEVFPPPPSPRPFTPSSYNAPRLLSQSPNTTLYLEFDSSPSVAPRCFSPDIDWEFPGYGPHGGTPADADNFVLLLRDVRSALDAYANATYPGGERTFGLTAALPCLPALVDHQDAPGLTEVLTELSLMTFDFHGTWSEVVGVNSPLYDDQDSQGGGGRSVDGCVERWLRDGADKSKINVGLPFYGRSYSGATELHADFDGPDGLNWWADGGEPQYYNILDKLSNMTSLRDDVTKTQYAFFEDGGVVSFDDNEAICDKVEYAREKELHGLFIWELSGDLTEDLKTPLLDAVNYKLEQGDSLDCEIFRLQTRDEDGNVAVQDGSEENPWYGEFQKG
jgi:chitinase